MSSVFCVPPTAEMRFQPLDEKIDLNKQFEVVLMKLVKKIADRRLHLIKRSRGSLVMVGLHAPDLPQQVGGAAWFGDCLLE